MTTDNTTYLQSLYNAFGGEYVDLDNTTRDLVNADFQHAVEFDGCMSATEYRSRIGVGNLASYGECLLIQSEQTWRSHYQR